MSDRELIEEVRRVARSGGEETERARRLADLIRPRTGFRWVGIYRVTTDDVRNLAWSGPGPPAHPVFPRDRGLTGVAIRSRSIIVSNDVSQDPRYLTNQDSTGSELIVPIVLEGEVVGTLDVEDAATDAFAEHDQAHFEDVAEALADLYAEHTASER